MKIHTRNAKYKFYIILSLLCLLISASNYFIETNTSKNLNYLVIQLFLAPLLIWSILYKTLREGATKTYLLVSLLCLYASAIAGSYLAHYNSQAKEAHKILRFFQGELQRVYESGASSRDSHYPRPWDQWGELRELVSGMADRSIEMQKEYEEYLSSLALERLLDPERLRTDHNLDESREIMKKWKEAYKDYKAKYKSDRKNYVNTLLKITPGFQEKSEELPIPRGMSGNIHEEILCLEKELILSYETIIELLSEFEWKINYGQVCFYDEYPTLKFNLCLKTIKKIEKKQKQLSELQIKKINTCLQEQLKKL